MNKLITLCFCILNCWAAPQYDQSVKKEFEENIQEYIEQQNFNSAFMYMATVIPESIGGDETLIEVAKTITRLAPSEADHFFTTIFSAHLPEKLLYEVAIIRIEQDNVTVGTLLNDYIINDTDILLDLAKRLSVKQSWDVIAFLENTPLFDFSQLTSLAGFILEKGMLTEGLLTLALTNPEWKSIKDDFRALTKNWEEEGKNKEDLYLFSEIGVENVYPDFQCVSNDNLNTSYLSQQLLNNENKKGHILTVYEKQLKDLKLNDELNLTSLFDVDIKKEYLLVLIESMVRFSNENKNELYEMQSVEALRRFRNDLRKHQLNSRDDFEKFVEVYLPYFASHIGAEFTFILSQMAFELGLLGTTMKWIEVTETLMKMQNSDKAINPSLELLKIQVYPYFSDFSLRKRHCIHKMNRFFKNFRKMLTE